MLKNIFDVVCGALAYYMVGYGISYGTPSNSFMGLGDYFVDGDLDDHLGTGLLYSRQMVRYVTGVDQLLVLGMVIPPLIGNRI